MSEHRTLQITPSRFQWNKFKDLFHFYLFLGAIPAGCIIFYANVFVGPATLSEIPEDYVPKHWEYYRVIIWLFLFDVVTESIIFQHPISRFIARYILTSPQQEYEKFLHYAFEEDEKRKLRYY